MPWISEKGLWFFVRKAVGCPASAVFARKKSRDKKNLLVIKTAGLL